MPPIRMPNARVTAIHNNDVPRLWSLLFQTPPVITDVQSAEDQIGLVRQELLALEYRIVILEEQFAILENRISTMI